MLFSLLNSQLPECAFVCGSCYAHHPLRSHHSDEKQAEDHYQGTGKTKKMLSLNHLYLNMIVSEMAICATEPVKSQVKERRDNYAFSSFVTLSKIVQDGRILADFVRILFGNLLAIEEPDKESI